MASIMKRNDENAAGLPDDDAGDDDAISPEADQKPAKANRADKAARKGGGAGGAPPVEYAKPTTPGGRGRKFYAIYKSGQGYWTRMCTLIGFGLLGVMLAYTLYDKIPGFFDDSAHGRRVGAAVAGIFLVVYTAVALYMMNKPANVDFLIATDSEMKKVNWTTRKELIGSTKVVVLFMLLTAFFLFAVDWVFHLIFYLAHVLKVPPPGIPGGH
jgi:preprotein translocase SecE subunit